MTKEQFTAATTENDLTNDQLKALWQEKRGNWERAHELAQKKEGDWDYDRIHAYLHRVEGDMFNAKWWYRQLAIPYPKVSISEEWEELVTHYLTF